MNIYMNLEVQNKKFEVFEIKYIILDKKPISLAEKASFNKIKKLFKASFKYFGSFLRKFHALFIYFKII